MPILRRIVTHLTHIPSHRDHTLTKNAWLFNKSLTQLSSTIALDACSHQSRRAPPGTHTSMRLITMHPVLSHLGRGTVDGEGLAQSDL